LKSSMSGQDTSADTFRRHALAGVQHTEERDGLRVLGEQVGSPGIIRSLVVARTVIRVLLVAGVLSTPNQLAPHEPLIQLCNWLLPAWAFRYLVGPIVRWLLGALRRVVARMRR
jgi:hypothetical protein